MQESPAQGAAGSLDDTVYEPCEGQRHAEGDRRAQEDVLRQGSSQRIEDDVVDEVEGVGKDSEGHELATVEQPHRSPLRETDGDDEDGIERDPLQRVAERLSERRLAEREGPQQESERGGEQSTLPRGVRQARRTVQDGVASQRERAAEEDGVQTRVGRDVGPVFRRMEHKDQHASPRQHTCT